MHLVALLAGMDPLCLSQLFLFVGNHRYSVVVWSSLLFPGVEGLFDVIHKWFEVGSPGEVLGLSRGLLFGATLDRGALEDVADAVDGYIEGQVGWVAHCCQFLAGEVFVPG